MPEFEIVFVGEPLPDPELLDAATELCHGDQHIEIISPTELLIRNGREIPS